MRLARWQGPVLRLLLLLDLLTLGSGCSKTDREVVIQTVLTNGANEVVCDITVRANRTFELRRFQKGVTVSSTPDR